MKRKLDLAAASAVLAAGDEVTMDDVAAGLRLAKPTLYRLAGSKADLVRACVDAEAERLLGHLHDELSADDPLVSTVRAVSGYAQRSPGGFRLLFGGKRVEAEEATHRVETRVAELLGRSEIVAAAVLGAAVAAVLRASGQDVELVAEELAAAL